MPSTAERVRRCIEEDVFLQEALACGIVAYSKMARWLQEHRGLEDDEKNISQSIPRDEYTGSRAMGEGWESLKGSRIDHHPGLAAVRVALTAENVEALGNIVETAQPERGGSLQILQEDSSLTLILDRERTDRVRQTFGEENVTVQAPDLTEIRVVPDGDALHPAVSSLAVAALTASELQPRFTIDHSSALSIFVDAQDSEASFQLLERLTE